MESMTSDLIIGFLKGSLNEKEINQFYDWVNETPENKKIFFEAKMVYDACLSKGSNIDMDKSWQRLLEKKQKQAPRKIYTLFRKVQAYAAVAVIAVAFTSVLFWWLGDTSSVPVARYVGGDGIVADKVVLPDGTEISMGSQTNFRYDPQYGKDKRVVYLEGEAYFEVTKNRHKPFTVQSDAMRVRVLGTTFNFKSDKNCRVAEATLIEGEIEVKGNKEEGQIILAPGQRAELNKKSGRLTVKQVDAKLDAVWHDNLIPFQKADIFTITKALERFYDVKIILSPDIRADKTYSGVLRRKSTIDSVLTSLQNSIPIDYKIVGSNIFISPK